MEAMIPENRFFSDLANLENKLFSLSAAESYPYLSGSFREALGALHYGLEYGNRILMLVADPGLGKTTLLRHFARHLHGRAVLLSHAHDPVEILSKLLAEIGGNAAPDNLMTIPARFDQILSGRAAADKPFVLLLDDVLDSEQPAIETIRHLALLSSFEKHLLRIIIAGSTHVAEKLLSSDVADEIRWVPLGPLAAAEVEGYIDYRLRLAGWRGGRLFTAQDYVSIAQQSYGKPSAINELCLNMLNRFQETQCPQSSSSTENKTTVSHDNRQGLLPGDGRPFQAVAAPLHNRRTAVLAFIVVTLMLAIAPFWYRNTIERHPVQHLAIKRQYVAAKVAIAKAPSVIAAQRTQSALPRSTPTASPPQRPPTPALASAAGTVAAAPTADHAMSTADDEAADEIRLGDGYMNTGEYDKALDSFLRAVASAPANMVAQEKVKRARRAKAAEQKILQ